MFESKAFCLHPLRRMTDVWTRYNGSEPGSVFEEAKYLELLTPAVSPVFHTELTVSIDPKTS